MFGLPPGWESDYDGQRWFYTYKASGHIQYHFPTEGDEFPDYLDASVPAPDLAPEERLESQQQLRRQTTISAASAKQLSPPSSHRAGNGAAKSGMSATARPVSAIWDGDGGGGDDDAEQVFQPENFMFLGPGTYTEVSPLNEEEEEAARRVVAGGIGERVAGDSAVAGGSAAGTKAAVSPVASTVTTPMVQKSEASVSPPVPAAGQEIVIESPPIQAEPVPTPPQEEQPVVHMIDSRELPQELPAPPPVFDPVGVVAEMATEHTAVAHIELHPDPVEMGDNAVLAPIETNMNAAALGMAELPERNSPVELKLPQKVEKPAEVATGSSVTVQEPDAVRQVSQQGTESQISGRLRRRTLSRIRSISNHLMSSPSSNISQFSICQTSSLRFKLCNTITNNKISNSSSIKISNISSSSSSNISSNHNSNNHNSSDYNSSHTRTFSSITISHNMSLSGSKDCRLLSRNMAIRPRHRSLDPTSPSRSRYRIRPSLSNKRKYKASQSSRRRKVIFRNPNCFSRPINLKLRSRLCRPNNFNSSLLISSPSKFNLPSSTNSSSSSRTKKPRRNRQGRDSNSSKAMKFSHLRNSHSPRHSHSTRPYSLSRVLILSKQQRSTRLRNKVSSSGNVHGLSSNHKTSHNRKPPNKTYPSRSRSPGSPPVVSILKHIGLIAPGKRQPKHRRKPPRKSGRAALLPCNVKHH
ncbi:hypothetical protein JDV02_004884 [Purpureocillium takamizusanense]|uniref:WW domain-containing protein n=1 Tax=Purpureocillium takamizusanense TaxID=2060973 RepID=A0A9Q8QFE8_9HYPO|nr:uncharacterized protein JDV02_004884 [Purpureocillium takamizusanense]UNI18630.1 hypothetical protein JDV02_004884 [Purpureocillium takamizusanense]